MDLLEFLEALGSDNKNQLDGIELEETEEERKLHFKQDLLFEFNNGSSQVKQKFL